MYLQNQRSSETAFPKKFCRTGDMVIIILPLKIFPCCCQKRCNYTIVAPSVSTLRNISSFIYMMHTLKSRLKCLWYPTCTLEIIERVNFHPCFQSVTYFDVDASNQNFHSKCNIRHLSFMFEHKLSQHKKKVAQTTHSKTELF